LVNHTVNFSWANVGAANANAAAAVTAVRTKNFIENLLLVESDLILYGIRFVSGESIRNRNAATQQKPRTLRTRCALPARLGRWMRNERIPAAQFRYFLARISLKSSETAPQVFLQSQLLLNRFQHDSTLWKSYRVF
jgi:hypothetical protein